MQLIALTGLAQSGKSTIAKHLVAKHSFHLVRFAGPLKNMLRSLGLDDLHIDGSLKEEPSKLLCGKSPRAAMQTLGTEWGRECIGDELWVNIWKRDVFWLISRGNKVVTDDCRFSNEANAVKKLGGQIWAVRRVFGLNDTRPPLHASEEQVRDIKPDGVLYNDGSVEGLLKKVEEALSA